MIPVWITEGGKGKAVRYYLRWQVPILEADGTQARYPSGRLKFQKFQEACKEKNRRTVEAFRQRKAQVLNGLVIPADPVKHVALSELAERDAEFLTNRGRATGTVYLSRLALTQLENSLTARGRPALADVLTSQDVESFISDRRESMAPKAVNNALAALRATFNRAVKAGMMKANPFANFDHLAETPREIIPLTPDEETKLLAGAASDLELNVFLRLVLDSGCRPGEICNLRMQDVAPDTGLGKITCTTDWKSKTRRNRRFAFTPLTAMYLRPWIAKRDGKAYLFREEGDKDRAYYHHVRGKFDRMVKRAGIARAIVFYDLRRTVGTLLAARGVNQRVAAEVMGHSNIATTARYYQAVSDDTLRGAVVNLRNAGA